MHPSENHTDKSRELSFIQEADIDFFMFSLMPMFISLQPILLIYLAFNTP